MIPSMRAFSDELMLIKQAEEEKHKSELPGMLKNRFLKSAPLFALGGGLGAGAGYLLGEKTRPWLLKNMTPGGRSAALAATTGLGAIGAIALWEAMRTAEKADRDATKRNS